jgi:hypothetical protein
VTDQVTVGIFFEAKPSSAFALPFGQATSLRITPGLAEVDQTQLSAHRVWHFNAFKQVTHGLGAAGEFDLVRVG